jgi:hypothetical protein
MEMDNKYDRENEKSRERLQKLLNSLTVEELNYVIYKEGWTVAVMLGHLAFWDERRLALIKNWEQIGAKHSDITGIDEQTVNDALIPIFLAMPPRKAAGLALTAAEKVDKEIAKLRGKLVKKIEGLGDEYTLYRSKHRNTHLDEIDEFLKVKRGQR